MPCRRRPPVQVATTSLPTSCSRQADTDRHGTTPDDTGRHVEAGSVRGASNLRIRWPERPWEFVSPLSHPPLTCGSSLEVRLARCRRKVSCSHLLREDRRRERASDSFSGGSKDEDGVRPMRVRDAKAGCPEIPLPRYPFFFVAEATRKPTSPFAGPRASTPVRVERTPDGDTGQVAGIKHLGPTSGRIVRAVVHTPRHRETGRPRAAQFAS